MDWTHVPTHGSNTCIVDAIVSSLTVSVMEQQHGASFGSASGFVATVDKLLLLLVKWFNGFRSILAATLMVATATSKDNFVIRIVGVGAIHMAIPYAAAYPSIYVKKIAIKCRLRY